MYVFVAEKWAVCDSQKRQAKSVHKFRQTIIVWGIKIKIKRILKEHANFLLFHIMCVRDAKEFSLLRS
jgi:hypothetical protein